MELKVLLKRAITASIRAGQEILAVYHSVDFGIEYKSDNSPLTFADKKSNDVIMRALGGCEIPILSEEVKKQPYSIRKNWDFLWIVDPLDGTKEFIKRNGDFTVNIALVERGVPILGVVYVPVSGELYYGMRDFGSFSVEIKDYDTPFEEISAKSEKLPKTKGPRPFTVVASLSHNNTETSDFIDKLRDKHRDLQIKSRGSSVKICMIASGDADVYPRFAPTMEWDTAAGHAIAKYAGKHFVDADTGKELEYNKEKLLNPRFVVK